MLQIFKEVVKCLLVKLTEDTPGGSDMLSPDLLLMFPGEDTGSQYKRQMLALSIKR